MDKLNKQELRRLAEAATFGPWESVERTGYDGEHYFLIQTQEERNGWEVAEIRMDVPHDNASFIAAANPAAILSLLDELERVYADRKYCWEEFKAMRRQADENERYLREELEQYRKDAERYQWLRGKVGVDLMYGDYSVFLPCGNYSGLDADATDLAIDSAMTKEGGANG